MIGKLRILLLASGLLALSGFSAQAACYQEMMGDPIMSCNGGIQGNSADFASNCTYVQGPPVQVEVTCPGMWVNTISDSETRGEACARVGLAAADLDGQVCAAGEARPRTGTNWDGIKYRYGTWGGPSQGGISDDIRAFNYRSGGSGTSTSITRHYCWRSGQKRDYDGTDITVAFYCS